MPRQNGPSADSLLATAGSAPPAKTQGSTVVRLGWMLGGTLTMVVTAMTIAGHPRWTLGFRDLIFWGAVVLTGTLRYWDVTRFRGETTGGEPATMADLKRYLAGLAAASVAFWVVAHSIQL